jgi:hypothetical protein
MFPIAMFKTPLYERVACFHTLSVTFSGHFRSPFLVTFGHVSGHFWSLSHTRRYKVARFSVAMPLNVWQKGGLLKSSITTERDWVTIAPSEIVTCATKEAGMGVWVWVRVCGSGLVYAGLGLGS